jgi:hypothetical protein
MSQFLFLRWLTLPLAAMSAAVPLVAAQNDVEPSGEAARREGFSQPDGTNYFALSLRAAAAAATRAPCATTPTTLGVVPVVPGPRELVVLFSSTASQAAGHRQKALAAVEATLARLDPGDRVKIMAYDLRAVPISDGFVAPNGPEVARAMAALRERVPLGAADLEAALLAAAENPLGSSGVARVIVLLGEGTSRAKAIGPEQFGKLVLRLVAQRTPVLSYGIGPRIDQPLLRALAGRTGGMAIEDGVHLTATEVGGLLASAAHASVYWPSGRANWPAGTEVYPKPLPPLRSDRDTVLVGTTKATAAVRLELGVEGPRGPQTLAWNLPALRADGGNGFLRPLVELARIDGGVTLPLLDMASLRQAQEELLLGGRDLDRLARTALAVNNLDGAEKLVTEALRRDPRDPQAAAIRQVLASRRQAGGDASGVPVGASVGPAADLSPARGANDLNLVGGGAPPGSAAWAPSASGQGALVERARQQVSAAEQALQMQVQTIINQARSNMGTDPERALGILRDEVEKVRQLPEPRPELRDQLVGQLQAAIRAGKARKTEYENHVRQIQEAAAAAEERMLAEQSRQRDQQSVKQLMERFEYLIQEGKYKEAEEDTAGEAAKIVNSRMDRPGNPQVVDATLCARAGDALETQLLVRLAKQKGFLEAMLQVEKAHVPTPDVPSIVYPGGDVWRELSARRIEKYGAADLSRRGPAEKKIDEALKSPTAIEFVQTPLGDVIDYLKDLHKIEIQLDKKELEGMSIGPDTLVTVSLKGISLRSALRLFLDDLGLKFVVHDEVLLITSPPKADNEFLTTRTYPLGDVVIPIRPPTFVGGFGNLGGTQGNNIFGNRNNANPLGGPGNNPFGNPGGNPFGNPGVGPGMGPGMGPGIFNVPLPGLPRQAQVPNVWNGF